MTVCVHYDWNRRLIEIHLSIILMIKCIVCKYFSKMLDNHRSIAFKTNDSQDAKTQISHGLSRVPVTDLCCISESVLMLNLNSDKTIHQN